MADVSVLCRIMPLDGDGFVEDFTANMTQYKHTIRRMGGFWSAEWFFPVDSRRPPAYLREWFTTRLMYRIEERSRGAVTWKGVIWEMYLTLDGITRRRTVMDIFNAVKTVYTDNDGNNQATAWSTNTASINRYGRRELILTATGIKSGEASALASSTLTYTADPGPEVTEIRSRAGDGLRVVAAGDIFTLNNKYVTAGDSTDGTTSSYVTDILNTDSDFLTIANINTNSLTTKKTTPVTMRAWDKIQQLAELGDASGDPWLFFVTNAGARFEQAGTRAIYEWRGEKEGLVYTAGQRSGWETWPWVLRDRTLRNVSATPNTLLEQANDVWIAEVEMTQGADDPHLIPDGPDDTAILRAQQNHLRWMEQERRKEARVNA